MVKTNKEILKLCMQKGFLLDKSLLDELSELNEELSKNLFISFLNIYSGDGVINKKCLVDKCVSLLKPIISEEEKTTLKEFFLKIGASESDFSSETFSNSKIDLKHSDGSIKVLFSPTILSKKVTVQDFVGHFRARYEQIRSILMDKNLENLKSLRRIGKDRETYYVIVCVYSKKITKNGNILIEVEDLNGSATVLINNNKKELFEKAKDILLDEVIAIGVSGNNEFLFANDIIYPDSVLPEKRKSNSEEAVAFISDIHIGSTMFLEENFLKFINWLNGLEGDESHKKLASKVKYLFITGDSVDGIGVFPDQEKFLILKDFFSQYSKLTDLLKKIRSDIHIIMCPGQHDAVWVGEPQPAIDETWAPSLFELDNLTLVTNPALIEIGEGFKVLMYHGASMHGIIEEIEEIRTKYGHSSPTRVVKEMLKRRHLSPIHGSCDYVPNEKRDLMTIDVLPDIICTGDQHTPEVSTYNNILLIASSCWQAKTPFEEKVGHEPDPCKVPILNLKTREVKILDFSSAEKNE